MSEPQYITLQAWAQKKFSPVPHHNTLHRWAKEGMIVPAPFKMGRDYMVTPNARHRNEPAPEKTVAGRLRHGLASA